MVMKEIVNLKMKEMDMHVCLRRGDVILSLFSDDDASILICTMLILNISVYICINYILDFSRE